MGPVCTEELRNCHWKLSFENWKHLKYDFSFHNSSLKNQRIEWWKQKPNGLLSHGSHNFWVMGDGNRVMSYENSKSKQPLSVRLVLTLKPTFFTIQLVFVTIYRSHCTFWYYSCVSLYYFSYIWTLFIILSAKNFQR